MDSDLLLWLLITLTAFSCATTVWAIISLNVFANALRIILKEHLK